MSYILVAMAVAGIMGYYLFKAKQELQTIKSSVVDFISTNDEMKKTLLVGLYHRYNKTGDPGKENPLDFEQFVAKVMSDIHSSQVYVTNASGDFGVDIEETRGEGLYLGQVKCYAENNPVAFDPIAILHSQIIKQNAKGGYIVTTGFFSSSAREYVEGLNIRLIEGAELVDLWVKSLDRKKVATSFVLKPTIS